MKRWWIVMMVILFLGACARTPNMKQYFFDSIPPHMGHKFPKTFKVLLVSNPTSASPYQSRDMLYISKPYQLSQFARHAWVSSPADMLAPLLVQTLQNSGRFHAVVSSPYVGSVDLRLDTKLLALYQEFYGEQNQVVLEVEASLIDVAESRLLKSQLFCARVNTRENTPYGGVVAANAAVEEILKQIATFVSIHSNYGNHELPEPRVHF